MCTVIEKINKCMADAGAEFLTVGVGGYRQKKEEARTIRAVMHWSCRHQDELMFIFI